MIAKKYRIERNFMDYILKKGESMTSKLFIIRYVKNNKKFCRYRTVISKKFAQKAIERNKAKRRIYEAIRVVSKETAPEENLDMIFIPKKTIIKKKYEDIEKEIKEILQKSWKK